MSLGLVLGGGGTVGEAFHRGVLRALAERDLDARAADVIVGTSAGSIVAASIRRSQPTTAVPALAARARRRLLPRRTAALTLLHRPRQALNALLLTPALASGKVSSDFLVGAVRRRDGDSWPAAALWIVAVRRADGRRVVFGRPGEPATDVASAVAASCAIPAYFTAMDVAGTDYVDGGVHSPTNADVLADLHLDLVVISSPMSVRPRDVRPRVDLPLRLVFHSYLRAEVWALRRRGDHVITIEPDAAALAVMSSNMMAAGRADEVEDCAYRLAGRRLDEGLSPLTSSPGAAREPTVTT